MSYTTKFVPKLVKVFEYAEDIIEISEIDYLYKGKSVQAEDTDETSDVDDIYKRNDVGRKGKKSSEVSKADREKNLKRVKKNVRRLAFSNGLGQVHLVLTYKENMQDIDKADNHFKEFMKSIHKIYKNLKYIATREFQKRGAIHYYVLLNHRIDIKIAQDTWKHGFISLAGHRNKLKAVMYVLKYITKEVGETVLESANGHTKKAYLSSSGLKKELNACTSEYLILQPERYEGYQKNIEKLIEKLPVGWDFTYEIEVSETLTLCGRSILRCADNNY